MESSLASSVNKERPSNWFFRQQVFTLSSTPTRKPNVAEFKPNKSSPPRPTRQFGTTRPFPFQSTPRRTSANICSTTQSNQTASSLNTSQLSNLNVQQQEFKPNKSSSPRPTLQLGTTRPFPFQSTPRRTSANICSTTQSNQTASSLNSSQLSNLNVQNQEFKQNQSPSPRPTLQLGTTRPFPFQSTPRRTSANICSTTQSNQTASSLNSSQLSNLNVQNQASFWDKENELLQLKVNFIYILLFNDKSPD
jgi:hypothetical protein